MIAVVVGVEDELDRLVGPLPDRSDDVFRLAGEVGIDDEDVVTEDDEALVATGEHRLGLRLAEEDTGSDLGDRRLLGGGRGGPCADGGEEESKERQKEAREEAERDRHGAVPDMRRAAAAVSRTGRQDTAGPAGKESGRAGDQGALAVGSLRASSGWRTLAARIVAAPA